MTPTQLSKIKGEFEKILDGIYLHGILNERRKKQETINLEKGEITIADAKQWFESKLVEIQMTQQQIELIKGEFFKEHSAIDSCLEWDIDSHPYNVWQWFESKLEEAERYKPNTATEVMFWEELKKVGRLNWLMARAIVKNKIDNTTLKYAEGVYNSQKDIYEHEKSNKLKK